jgi:ubiquinone/menaquinone biosynthesis C-methylase UbiE
VGIVGRWFPGRIDRKNLEKKLARFYAENAGYHAMVASGDKTCHPQVRLLQCLIHSDGRYVEVGCGSGSISRLVGETASVIGVDVSQMAIERARQADCSPRVEFRCAPAEGLPFPDNESDGCFSFEVLEHVWDPVVAFREMVRITKPGGFILMSAPLAFSLDLHLRKHFLARASDYVMALARLLSDSLTARPFCNITPCLEGEVFPDCDAVSTIIPCGFVKSIERFGCKVDLSDTTYMCAHRDGSTTDLTFQRNTVRPFVRNFGDHILLLAHKNPQ